ncbi:hypothetical protein CSC29_6314 [Pseudomonas aeruginosa]|nr:hypothetical protein CSC29_6314 [Pseudomonas aeruginosa]
MGFPGVLLDVEAPLKGEGSARCCPTMLHPVPSSPREGIARRVSRSAIQCLLPLGKGRRRTAWHDLAARHTSFPTRPLGTMPAPLAATAAP